MKRTKNTLKTYFQTGDVPEQWQYENLIDSFWHLDDTLPNSGLDDQLARKNEDNQFSSIQTFNNDINIVDPQPYLSIIGTDATNRSAKIGLNTPGGLWTLENSNDFRIDFNGESSFLSLGRLASGAIQLGTNNTERYLIDASGNHDFKMGTASFGGTITAGQGMIFDQLDHTSRLKFTRSGHTDYGLSLLDGRGLTVTNLNSSVKEMQFSSTGKVDFNAEIIANNGIEAHGHIKLNENSWLWSQYSPSHAELRLNSNANSGWDFFNQTDSTYANIRAGGAEFNGLISAYNGIRINNGSSLYLGNSNNTRMFHNGSHFYMDNFTGDFIFRNLLAGGNMQFAVDDLSDTQKTLIYLSGSNQYVSLRHDGNEKLRTTATGIELNGAIDFPYSSANEIFINQDNGTIGYGKMIPFSNAGKFEFDTHYTGNGSYEWKYNGSPVMHLYSNGNLKPTGSYVSSDGTAGFTGTFSTSTHNITVKDGIITDAALI